MTDWTFTVSFDYPSHDGRSTVNAQLWMDYRFGLEGEDAIQPKGVLQFIHGMTEHIERYDDYARYFVERGFVVCAEDHIGHGHTVPSREELGHLPVNGKQIVLDDIHTLYTMVHQSFPDLPYVMYGHSMGSLILRAYIARFGTDLDAVVLSATHNGPFAVSLAGQALARTMALFKGDQYRSQFFYNQSLGDYSEQIENARTQLDWLTHDEDIIDGFLTDELSNFNLTVGGFATLLDITGEVVTKGSASRIPKELPMLIVGGDGDPMGEYGKALQDAYGLYQAMGMENVDLKIYEGMRHEVHNEVGREQVYEEIADWIEEHIPSA